MKNHIYSLSLILFSTILFSCGKQNVNPSTNLASFNIINVATNSSGMVANFSDSASAFLTYYSIGYGSAYLYSPESGNRPLVLADLSDTAKPFLNTTYNLKLGGIYSLFVSGDVSAPDTLMTQDMIPNYPFGGDSVTGVRFVNLSKGGNPISIDIAGIPNTSVNSSLAYRTITSFQSFPATSTATANGYTFEFRDAVSDSLLATFPLNIVAFKSQTLSFYGNATVGLNVMSMNNY